MNKPSGLLLAGPALVILALAWPSLAESRGCESPTAKAFATHWTAAEKAYAGGELREAATHYAKVAAILPFEPTSHQRLACCWARLGEVDKALAALRAAVDCGWADADALASSDDLKSLRENHRFLQLVKESAACRAESFLFYAGEQVGRDQAAPLLVVLQGLGCGPRSELPYWKPAADRLRMVVVAPQATTQVSPMLRSWHRRGAKDSTQNDYFDLQAASERVDQAIAEAQRRYRIDPQRIVLAGFSQGGGVALHLVAERPERYRGVVAVCSLCQTPDKGQWAQVAQIAQPGGVRIHVIAGERDALRERSRTAIAVLREAGLPTQFEIVKESGHEYPTDYGGRLWGATRYVLTGELPQ